MTEVWPLGEMLRTHRVRAGLTQREVAGLAGVSVRTLRDVEHGQVRLPRPDTLRRLARVVGLPDDLLAAGEAALGTFIGVLGPLRVEQAGSPAEVGTGKRRTLLALLALHPNRVVGHAEIVEALWRQSPPASHRKLVSGYVAELRPVLGDCGPEAAGGGYRLSIGAEQLDLLRFEELARRADTDRLTAPTSALQRYRQALACWRGPVLSGEDPALRAYPVAAGLTRRRIAVLLAFADLAIELGEHASAEAELRQVIDDEPLHEGLHARLMLALAGAGQQSAALRLYTEVRTRLADELGVDPSQELRAAHQRVLGQQVGGTDRNQRTPAQLPADVTGFAGRESQIGQLDALLAANDRPLVAIIGSAGVGKTALAVHWAHSIRERFPDGQLYADLRGYSLDSPARPVLVLAQFLRALGVPAERVPVDPAEASALYRTLLADRRMLVVLDNAASSDHVRPLLPGSPDCLVLITSRDRLTGLTANPGAHRIELDVLTKDESTALLTNLLGADRVAAAPTATAQLARLCAYLPLALRVAAADLVSQPHRDIEERTAELAADRLGMLDAAGDTSAAVRHAFGYSYTALPDRTRRVFRLLGLIPGEDFTDGLVAAMSAIPIESARRELDRLAAAHLVMERAPRRYTFHDLLREYATEQSRTDDPATNQEALRRLDGWYLSGADAAVNRLYPGVTRLPVEAPQEVTFDSDKQGLRWLDGERANLLACIRRAAGADNPSVAWLLADTLRTYFWSGMRSIDWLHATQDGMRAAIAANNPQAQAAMQLSLGNLHLRIRRFTDSLRHSSKAVELSERARWLPGQAAAHQNLGNLRRRAGELTVAIDHYQQALRVNTSLGFVGALAVNLASLGQAHHELGELTTAVDYYTKSLAAHRSARTRGLRATATSLLGKACHELGQLDRAAELLTEAIELNKTAGNRAFESEARGALARVHLDAGRGELAVELADTALTLAQDCDDPTIRAAARSVVAETRMRGGDNPDNNDSSDLSTAVTSYQRALHDAHGHSARLELEILNGLAEAKRRLGEYAEATRLSARASRVAGDIGYRMTEAQALATMAAIDLDLDRREQAKSSAQRAFELYQAAGHPRGVARCRELLAAAFTVP